MNKTLSAIVMVAAAALVLPACSDTDAASAEKPAEAKAPYTGPVETQMFVVTGMHCEGCASGIATDLAKIDGVERVEVSAAKESAVIDCRPDGPDAAALIAAIEKLGYKAKLPDAEPTTDAPQTATE